MLVLLAILAGAATFLALFYVPNENVEVLGNTRYQNSEIRKLAMPGFLDHNSIYLRLFRKSIETSEVPFVDSIDVEYMGRDRVRLHVHADYPVGYLLQDGYRMYFDSVGLVVEAIDAEGEEDTPADAAEEDVPEIEEDVAAEDTEEIESSASSEEDSSSSSETEFRPALSDVTCVTGLTKERVTPGEIIPVEDASIFQTLLVLNKLISKFEILPDEIALDEENAITLHYDKAAIALGGTDLLEEKMTRAAAILPQLKGLEGTLHLEHFTNETINIIFEQAQKEEPPREEEPVGTTDLVGTGTDIAFTEEEEGSWEVVETPVEEWVDEETWTG